MRTYRQIKQSNPGYSLPAGWEECDRCRGDGLYKDVTSILDDERDPWCFKCNKVGIVSIREGEDMEIDINTATQDEIDRATIEWDESEHARLELARMVGIPEPILREDAMVPNFRGIDPLSDKEIDLMEQYIQLSQKREKLPEMQLWIDLRAARAEAWSNFTEKVDDIWLPWQIYKDKLDWRLLVLENEDKKPTEEQWAQAMGILRAKQDFCQREWQGNDGQWRVDYRGYQGFSRTAARNSVTYAAYQKAQTATEACRKFWSTEAGERLNEVNEERRELWQEVCEEGLDKRFKERNQLATGEFNLHEIWGLIDATVDDTRINNGRRVWDLSYNDRRSDLESGFWYQLAGLPDEAHYDLCEGVFKAPQEEAVPDRAWEKDWFTEEEDEQLALGLIPLNLSLSCRECL